ncbi:MAG: OadG family transporter subunit [Methylococcaceae bacterium]|jgi:oxaloacetate decarboxylase gamma subunit|nr:OadG family transporter subunit [Methylococcaceae bacterium]MDZ4155228.1 OadG family transporter subunit [Methylococcales bacterium]MDP2393500.1 OadG family transporter subunit [Methylococcaceae bacterium]MDP3021370.1 OadG family transporter subunit [Methylococcaceae bacterium]MDP3391039.1 OadG family transporter subunit [Methylococcaceae bacterium]
MSELISSGLELLVAGMGIVFLFLTMLVVAINLMSAMVLRFFPDEPKTSSSLSSVVSSNDKRIVAAITAAVHQYRHDHK